MVPTQLKILVTLRLGTSKLPSEPERQSEYPEPAAATGSSKAQQAGYWALKVSKP